MKMKSKVRQSVIHVYIETDKDLMTSNSFLFGNKGRLTLGMFNQNQLEFYY